MEAEPLPWLLDQELPWSPNGRTVVAAVIAQCTLLVGQRRHNGCTMKADASLKLKQFVYTSAHFYGATNGRPLCIHSAITAIYAFHLPPLSDLWAINLLDDLSATVLNMLKTSRRPWRLWRGLNVLCATLERPRQTLGLLCAFNGDLANFVVAQGGHRGRSPCVKGLSMNTCNLLCLGRVYVNWVPAISLYSAL